MTTVPLYCRKTFVRVFAYPATRTYFQQEHNIGKIKKNLEDFYLILPFIDRVGRLTL